jgi:spermidine synthase
MALWYDEVHDQTLRFGLKIRRTLYTERSEFQEIAIVETERYGKALLLDDIWMTLEEDERTYHEMLVHPALTTAPKIERVLIIGGGDGGTAREVLRHPEVKRCDLCEIDGQLIDACREHLAEIGTAWDDPRLEVHVGDGVEYVARYDGPPYDVVLVDGCDPVGPAAALFGEPFYRDVASVLSEDGVFATQSEDPHLYHDVHVEVVRRLRDVFGSAHPYYAGVMIYPGNTWSWTWASRNVDHFAADEGRAERLEAVTEYYNRDIHRAAFALPNFVQKALS